uniref:Malic enzyme n=1 Tax=Spongospora subterranea TaxID=70186 RepID=A0A0H5RK73_9EUKA|eukprot:CRZ09129.1 hypothetical protein [Spongospora subterranea]
MKVPTASSSSLALPIVEREIIGVQGLLPASVQSPSQIVDRFLTYINSLSSDLNKFVFVQQLHVSDRDMFYHLLINHIEMMMPIVYTPTVGLACQRWSDIYFNPQGLYIPITAAGRVSTILNHWPEQDVSAIVFTDGGRILGLGDLAANGMGIPIGKLSLYVTCAGIHPSQVLPVVLDVGTDNEELLNDPNYIGLRQRRSKTSQISFDEFVGEFLSAVVARYGRHTLMQFEDFATNDALRLLSKYRHAYMTFNDDVQGTAAMTLAGILSALPLLKSKHLHEQTIVFSGAGSAGIGIAQMIAHAMAVSGDIDYETARKNIWAVDSRGLIVADRPKGGLDENKMPFAHQHEPVDNLSDVIDIIKPTVLIGVSSQANSFDSIILNKMANYNERPVIFALSNPTSKSECSAEDAIKFTNGRALFASGSPFAPVEYNSQIFDTCQANNVYVFPGIGLGAIVASASQISDEMLMAAAQALADQVSDEDRSVGSLYPHIKDIRNITAHIAMAVAREAFNSSLATVPQPKCLESAVKEAMMYNPTVPQSIPCKL